MKREDIRLQLKTSSPEQRSEIRRRANQFIEHARADRCDHNAVLALADALLVIATEAAEGGKLKQAELCEALACVRRGYSLAERARAETTPRIGGGALISNPILCSGKRYRAPTLLQRRARSG